MVMLKTIMSKGSSKIIGPTAAPTKALSSATLMPCFRVRYAIRTNVTTADNIVTELTGFGAALELWVGRRLYFTSRIAYLRYAELSTMNAKIARTQIKITRTMVVLLGVFVPSGFFILVPRNAVNSPTMSSTIVNAIVSLPP